jgi:hypothetical protein
MAGELTTANYGWVKPTVGSSTDAWGGYINADLDGIDSTVHSIQTSVPAASSTAPAMDGTAAVGVGATFARADHVHPTDASRAPLISPALTGTPTAPTAAPGTNTTQIATTAFVEALPVAMNDNRIINGDNRIDQRNNGASGTATGYTVDRWQYSAVQASKGTWQRVANNLAGFPYCLSFISSSAYSPLAGDTFYFSQVIEADMASDFAWGTANAQPVTLSFWVQANAAGTYSGAIANYPLPATRSYPFSYSIPAANTWTKISLIIPGDTAGTWVMSGNAAAMTVRFELGGGATFRGPAGAWASGNFIGANGAASVVATNGATFYVTGVKLEIGTVATPFNRQSLAKSLADCQRYYQTGYLQMNAYNTAGAATGQTVPYIVTPRAAPTIVLSNQTYNNASGAAVQAAGVTGFTGFASVTAAGNAMWNFNYTASAEL